MHGCLRLPGHWTCGKENRDRLWMHPDEDKGAASCNHAWRDVVRQGTFKDIWESRGCARVGAVGEHAAINRGVCALENDGEHLFAAHFRPKKHKQPDLIPRP